MGRSFGRVGGASAGIIAIAFGVLDLLAKTPPPWMLIGLGIVAVLGVLADYFVERKSEAGQAPRKAKQKQKTGKNSKALQAGGNISDVRFRNPEQRADES